jgi:hypothetical protein
VAPGDWLQNALRPVIRYALGASPFSVTGVAMVVGHSQSEPPLVAMTMPSPAMRRSTPSASGAPARRRKTCSRVRYWCMAWASPVAPSWRASSAWA